MIERITPVLLCGGAGTRLWPLSRPELPKPLLALCGAETMLQQTAARTSDGARFGAPVVVAAAEQADAIEAQLAAIGAAPDALILEPASRNTAPAIALAALSAEPDALLLVMPSDHVIADVAAFRAGVEKGAAAAAQGWLVTFGITPTRAETGYGYICVGEPLADGVARARRFVEKPDAATAETFFRDGGYLWNAGIFLFRAGLFLETLRRAAPDVADAASWAIDRARREGARIHPAAEAFNASPSISVDHAVMEQAERIAVLPLDIGWSDVGSWETLHEASAQDDAGNSVRGEALLIDVRGCLVRSEGPRIVAIGVEDLVIVATADSVLVVPKAQSQRVREVSAAALEEPGPCAG